MEHGSPPLSPAHEQDLPLNKRETATNNKNNNSNDRQSVDIILGVILGVALFFIFSMMIAVFCSIRSRQKTEDPNSKVSLSRLRKLEAVAPTRNLGEWWPTVKRSLDMSQVVETHFVCVVCFDQVQRTQEIHELKCLHVFHKECLEKWYLRSHYKCPMCQCVFFQERERYHSATEYIMVA